MPVGRRRWQGERRAAPSGAARLAQRRLRPVSKRPRSGAVGQIEH